MIIDDAILLRRAYMEAQKSLDPSTQIGAILFNPAEGMVAAGCNEFCRGIRTDIPERWSNRETKLFYIEHAERNAIYDACRKGVKTEGLILFAPWFACVDCGRAIIQAGIKEVVGHQIPVNLTPERWKASIDAALDMMKEAGVKMRWVDEPIDINIRFNGKLTSMIDGKVVE